MRAKNSHAWAPLTQQMRLIINSFQNGSSVKGESNHNVIFCQVLNNIGFPM